MKLAKVESNIVTNVILSPVEIEGYEVVTTDVQVGWLKDGDGDFNAPVLSQSDQNLINDNMINQQIASLELEQASALRKFVLSNMTDLDAKAELQSIDSQITTLRAGLSQ